jgi:GT2 family glycosyltransferase
LAKTPEISISRFKEGDHLLSTNKIGVGIVTCNREEMFKKCVNSIPDFIQTLVVVNDATPYNPLSYPKKVTKLIENKTHIPVGVSKNILLRYFMEGDFEHIFLLEDDIYIKDPNVFDHYIKTMETTGILHFNYGYHGPDNRDCNGAPKPRIVVNYENGIKLALNTHVLGAFSYYHRLVIEKVGYMDERFQNAWEHVEHTARIAEAGYHPPFWWFADVYESDKLIGEQDIKQEKSVIRKNKSINLKYMKEGEKIFKESMGFIPVKMPPTSLSLVLMQLNIIRHKYARI